MYRRPKFLEILIDIRREMALESDYDVELFAEMARSGAKPNLVPKEPTGDSDLVPDTSQFMDRHEDLIN